MNRGRILRVSPGHQANCSALDYMGQVMVSLFAYVVLLGGLIVIQALLWRKSKPASSKLKTALWAVLKIALWAVPHLVALALLFITAYASGAMDYGSVDCVRGVAILMVFGGLTGLPLVLQWLRDNQPKPPIVSAPEEEPESGATL